MFIIPQMALPNCIKMHKLLPKYRAACVKPALMEDLLVTYGKALAHMQVNENWAIGEWFNDFDGGVCG